METYTREILSQCQKDQLKSLWARNENLQSEILSDQTGQDGADA